MGSGANARDAPGDALLVQVIEQREGILAAASEHIADIGNRDLTMLLNARLHAIEHLSIRARLEHHTITNPITNPDYPSLVGEHAQQLGVRG